MTLAKIIYPNINDNYPLYGIPHIHALFIMVFPVPLGRPYSIGSDYYGLPRFNGYIILYSVQLFFFSATFSKSHLFFKSQYIKEIFDT